MVDLVPEDVRQQPVHLLRHAPLAAQERHGPPEIRGAHRFAQRDESPIHRALRGREVGHPLERFRRFVERPDVGMRLAPGHRALHRVGVHPVHGQDVVQRGLEGRKETRSRRGELRGRKCRAGPEEAVVGPGILVGPGREMPLQGDLGGSHRRSGKARLAGRVLYPTHCPFGPNGPIMGTMATPPTPPPARKRTLYDILGVDKDANAIDIGIAYKAKIDGHSRNPGADPNEVNLVHEAYHVLCMPNERAAYDAKLITMAEKAAARSSAMNPDLVLEPEDEDSPVWKNKYVLTGGALVLAFLAFWMVRSPAKKSEPTIVAQRELRPEAAAPVPQAPISPVLAPRSAEDLFADLSRSTARITAHDVSGRAVGIGSGVVTGIGTVVTNCHVAAAGGALTVKVGGEQFSASVEVADEEYDLCRLSVLGLTAPAVNIGTAESLKTGQKVYAIGAPQGLDLTISDGIVSGKRDLPQGRVIQTTAPISPGSSGGPLFDVFGRLVGIMTFQLKSGQNLNFAVPADWIANMRSRSATNPMTESMSRSMAPN